MTLTPEEIEYILTQLNSSADIAKRIRVKLASELIAQARQLLNERKPNERNH